jgi:ribonucleoside-triphosphate reductase
LPQEVVDEQTYHEYNNQLLAVNIEDANSFDEITDDECATGACPVK